MCQSAIATNFNLYTLCENVEQIADILTKEVLSSVLHSALCKVGMRDIFASALGGVLEIFYMILLSTILFYCHHFCCNPQ